MSGRCFAFFKHRQMTNNICWVRKSRTGEATNWPSKIENFTWYGEAKFSLGEGKKSTGSGFTGSVTERCIKLLVRFKKSLISSRSCPASS